MQVNLTSTELPLELKERVQMAPFWHHGDGDGWTFHSELLIDEATIYINDYNLSVSDISSEIKEEKLGLNNNSIKDIARFAHALTRECFLKKPTISADEAYYGWEAPT